MIKAIANTENGEEQCRVDVVCMTRTELIGEAVAAIATICRSVVRHAPDFRSEDLLELALDVVKEQQGMDTAIPKTER